MDKHKNIVLLITICLLLLGNFVSAATVTFVDAAYIKNGTLSISSPGGNPITALNTTESAELQNGTAYMIDYQPNGYQKLNAEAIGGFGFPTLQFLIAFFSDPVNLITLLVIVIALLMIAGSI
jgi:hypothetical protein